MNKPHKHAEVIKAWADGAEIELYDPELNRWRSSSEYPGTMPKFSVLSKYRVKPQPVLKYHGIMQGTDGYECMNHTTGYHSEVNHVRSNDNKWKVIAIVKTTFVDNFPVSVEII